MADLLIVRYRPGVVGESLRVTHLVEIPAPAPANITALTTLCGKTLALEDIETLDAVGGRPCTPCLARSPGRDATVPRHQPRPLGPRPRLAPGLFRSSA
jgi:hypothetical protein